VYDYNEHIILITALNNLPTRANRHTNRILYTLEGGPIHRI